MIILKNFVNRYITKFLSEDFIQRDLKLRVYKWELICVLPDLGKM